MIDTTSRLLWETLREKRILAAVDVFIAGAAAALWVGSKNMLK